jgi:hypothetical protein
MCRKILRHWASGFTSPPKEGALQIFIVLQNPSPLPGFNLRILGPLTIAVNYYMTEATYMRMADSRNM